MNDEEFLEENPVYNSSTIDFVTVATEYCKQLEQLEEVSQESFLDIMLRLLPMVYFKATTLPEVQDVMGYNEPAVTEDDYNFVRSNVARIMGSNDDFLDTFVEDFKYSEHPVLQTISENLADIYQCLRDFVETFRSEMEESMHIALFDTKEQFYLSWGQKLLNAMRALHDVKYGSLKQSFQ